ncbi:alpha/beta hydrolase [Amycolatopsis antarctica]|uniref:Alpha/beta hydrolase n=1 Tax=Amycolatopsis antarctica TaxID=1854586 RepID=A0A263D144_9PSEU|nr:prolyl oligopeptidase family serine peptidase [Amycolatopsis antarctica]OZM72160.1 alpha/beta hydrolase [Amycolatopsis antarctica]
MRSTAAVTGLAAGVPYLALPPQNHTGPAPLVVTWHMMDPPRTEAAMAAAVPMAGLPAWRVHFGLPMFGSRVPEGGPEAFYALAGQDYVLNVAGPVTERAADEFPAAVRELRRTLSIVDGPVGVVGGSAGGAVALEVMARAEVPITAAGLVNPVTTLAAVVAANERRYGVTYTWTERSRAVADRLDFVRRADELPGEVLLVLGGLDDISVTEPAARLAAALGGRGHLVTVDDLEHALAEEPGVDPAPQTPAAVTADAALTDWFRSRLTG